MSSVYFLGKKSAILEIKNEKFVAISHFSPFSSLCRSILISAQYGQRISFGDPPYDECSLWNLKTFPTKPYAVAIYPKFAQMKNASSNTGYGSDVVVFYQDDKIMVQSFRKLKEG